MLPAWLTMMRVAHKYTQQYTSGILIWQNVVKKTFANSLEISLHTEGTHAVLVDQLAPYKCMREKYGPVESRSYILLLIMKWNGQKHCQCIVHNAQQWTHICWQQSGQLLSWDRKHRTKIPSTDDRLDVKTFLATALWPAVFLLFLLLLLLFVAHIKTENSSFGNRSGQTTRLIYGTQKNTQRSIELYFGLPTLGQKSYPIVSVLNNNRIIEFMQAWLRDQTTTTMDFGQLFYAFRRPKNQQHCKNENKTKKKKKLWRALHHDGE